MGWWDRLLRRGGAPAAVSPQEELLIVPVPSLVATLVAEEREKGAPLTEEEVLRTRDNSPAIALYASIAKELAEERGYDDLDPENIWNEWQRFIASEEWQAFQASKTQP